MTKGTQVPQVFLEAEIVMLVAEAEANPLAGSQGFTILDPSAVLSERPNLAASIGNGFVIVALAIRHYNGSVRIPVILVVFAGGLVAGGFDSLAILAYGNDGAGMAISVHGNGSSHSDFGLGT